MEIKSRMPGKVDELKVKVGDTVAAGDVIMVMEALKMKTPVLTQQAGTVKEIKAAVGDRVNAGQVLAVIE